MPTKTRQSTPQEQTIPTTTTQLRRLSSRRAYLTTNTNRLKPATRKPTTHHTHKHKHRDQSHYRLHRRHTTLIRKSTRTTIHFLRPIRQIQKTYRFKQNTNLHKQITEPHPIQHPTTPTFKYPRRLTTTSRKQIKHGFYIQHTTKALQHTTRTTQGNTQIITRHQDLR